MKTIIRAISFLTIFLAAPAMAQSECFPRAEALKYLWDNYKEVPVANGLSNRGVVVEVLASPGGATWTITVTMPNGVSCLLQAGENWERITSLPLMPSRPSL